MDFYYILRFDYIWSILLLISVAFSERKVFYMNNYIKFLEEYKKNSGVDINDFLNLSEKESLKKWYLNFTVDDNENKMCEIMLYLYIHEDLDVLPGKMFFKEIEYLNNKYSLRITNFLEMIESFRKLIYLKWVYIHISWDKLTTCSVVSAHEDVGQASVQKNCMILCMKAYGHASRIVGICSLLWQEYIEGGSSEIVLFRW